MNRMSRFTEAATAPPTMHLCKAVFACAMLIAGCLKSEAWETGTHVELAEVSLQKFVATVITAGDGTLCAQLLQDNWNLVSQTLVQEDLDSYLGVSEGNVVYHFWDPASDAGFLLFESAKTRASSLFSQAATEYRAGHISESFRLLGRVCHLVQDMGVPAHTLLDSHLPKLEELRRIWGVPFFHVCDTLHFGDGDFLHAYAINRARHFHWTTQVLPPLGFSLGEVMYNVAIVSRRYDSDDCDGTFDQGARRAGGFTVAEGDQVLAVVIPRAEQAVAVVFKLFFDEVRPPRPIFDMPSPGKIYNGSAGIPLRATVVPRPPATVTNVRSIRFESQDKEGLLPNQWVLIREINVLGTDVAEHLWQNNFHSGNMIVRAVALDAAGCDSPPATVTIQIDSTPPKILNQKP